MIGDVTMDNLRVGRPDTSPSKPSHVRGVREGNQPGGVAREEGLVRAGGALRATGRRSTGINPDRREPLAADMPVLTPP